MPPKRKATKAPRTRKKTRTAAEDPDAENTATGNVDGKDSPNDGIPQTKQPARRQPPRQAARKKEKDEAEAKNEQSAEQNPAAESQKPRPTIKSLSLEIEKLKDQKTRLLNRCLQLAQLVQSKYTKLDDKAIATRLDDIRRGCQAWAREYSPYGPLVNSSGMSLHQLMICPDGDGQDPESDRIKCSLESLQDGSFLTLSMALSRYICESFSNAPSFVSAATRKRTKSWTKRLSCSEMYVFILTVL